MSERTNNDNDTDKNNTQKNDTNETTTPENTQKTAGANNQRSSSAPGAKKQGGGTHEIRPPEQDTPHEGESPIDKLREQASQETSVSPLRTFERDRNKALHTKPKKDQKKDDDQEQEQTEDSDKE